MGQSVGIVVAMDAELRHLLPQVSELQEEQADIWTEWRAVLSNVPLVIVRSGIGMVNAAAATERLIADHQPSAILNFGCAGAHRRDVLPGDVVIGERVVHHAAVHILASGEEFYSGFGYEVGGEKIDAAELVCDPDLVGRARQAAARFSPAPWPRDLGWPAAVPYRLPTVHHGVIASADVWTQAPARLDLLHERHRSLCEDMEAAAIAQVCALHHLPFLTIKDISNNEYHAATDITEGFSTFPTAEVGRRAAALLVRTLNDG